MDINAANDPNLPMELFYRVIECLDRKRDSSTLKSCSTVCKAFVPQCQRVIFHSVDMSSKETAVRPLIALLKKRTGLASVIRRFQYFIGKDVTYQDRAAISELVLPNVETLIINGWVTYTQPMTEHGHYALAILLCWPSIHAVEIQGFKRFPPRLLRLPRKMSLLYISPAGLSDGGYFMDPEPLNSAAEAIVVEREQNDSSHPSIQLEHLVIDRNVSSALLQKLLTATSLCGVDVSTLATFQLALKPAGRETYAWPNLISSLRDFLQLVPHLKTLQIAFPLYYNQSRIDLSQILSPLLPTLTTLSFHWSGAQLDEEWLLGHLSDFFIAIHEHSRLERVELALEYTKIPVAPPAFKEEQTEWLSFAEALTKTIGLSTLRELSIQLSLCELRGISKKGWKDYYMCSPRMCISQVARNNGIHLDFRLLWVQIQSGALRQSIAPMK